MAQESDGEELVVYWTLSPTETTLVESKRGPARLGFAVLLKFFQREGRFPQRTQDVSPAAIAHLAAQVGVPAAQWRAYDWHGRAIKYHRAEIRTLLGFREATLADSAALETWLGEQVLPTTVRLETIVAAAYERLRALRIEPPTRDRLDRVIRSALHAFEQRVCTDVVRQLSSETRTALETLLTADGPGPQPSAPESEETSPSSSRALLYELRADAGRATLATLFREVAKLEQIRAVALPADLFAAVAPKVVQAYRDRAAVEAPYELRRHPEPLRLTLLAAFCQQRQRELTDTLVELLLDLIHRIGAKAERKVEKELLEDFKRVHGKTGMLYRVAEATLAQPTGVVQEVVFPVVSEGTLRDIVKEWKSTGPIYRYHVQTVMQGSYRSHYRRMLPRLLETLEFRSNNALHQPLIRALALLRQYLQSRLQTYPVQEEIPLDGVVREGWRDVVLTTDTQGRTRVNRIAYELCVLQSLRDRLRCKEIWVVGANRYRNPDEDVPSDFAVQRPAYYAALQLPTQAEDFVRQLQHTMRDELAALDRTLPHNADVEILEKAKGWIKLSP